MLRFQSGVEMIDVACSLQWSERATIDSIRDGRQENQHSLGLIYMRKDLTDASLQARSPVGVQLQPTESKQINIDFFPPEFNKCIHKPDPENIGMLCKMQIKSECRDLHISHCIHKRNI